MAYCAPHDFNYGPLIMSRDIIWAGMPSFQTGFNKPMYIHYSQESGQTYVVCGTEKVRPMMGQPSYVKPLFLKEVILDVGAKEPSEPGCERGLFCAARFETVNGTLVKIPTPAWVGEQVRSFVDTQIEAQRIQMELEEIWREEEGCPEFPDHAAGKDNRDSSPARKSCCPKAS